MEEKGRNKWNKSIQSSHIFDPYSGLAGFRLWWWSPEITTVFQSTKTSSPWRNSGCGRWLLWHYALLMWALSSPKYDLPRLCPQNLKDIENPVLAILTRLCFIRNVNAISAFLVVSHMQKYNFDGVTYSQHLYCCFMILVLVLLSFSGWVWTVSKLESLCGFKKK